MNNNDGRLSPWLAALAEDGRIDDAELRRASNAGCRDAHPLIALASLSIIDHAGERLDASALLDWLARRFRLPPARIDPMQLDIAAVTAAVPLDFARHHGLLVLRIESDAVDVACDDPFRIALWRSELESALGRSIRPALCHPERLRHHIEEFYALQASVDSAEARQDAQASTALSPPLELGAFNPHSRRHTEVITDWLLRYALRQRSSDLHLEARDDEALVRLRIDGLLHNAYRLPAAVATAIANRLKVLAQMDPTERRLPQDGHIRLRVDSETVELRLSTMPTACGEKLVVRLLHPKWMFRNLNSLGMETVERHRWLKISGGGGGLALVTGPTGSGKTTTLYSTLKHFSGERRNICTIEDPIEIIDADFNQTQIRPEIGLDFAAGVRALLRQDPDMIMIGEIRDHQTARMAAQAALTGHKVLATMHTGDSVAAIMRLLELQVPAWLLRATLSGALAQRLAPKLCEICRRHQTPNTEAEHLWRRLSDAPPPEKIVVAAGCAHCRRTGVRGNCGLFEALTMDSKLRARIDDDASVDALQAAARDAGFRPLREQAAQRVRDGDISLPTACALVS